MKSERFSSPSLIRSGILEPSDSPPEHCFKTIVNGVRSVANPRNMVPIVCFSSLSFPIVTVLLHSEDSCISTKKELPIVVSSLYGKGRVICYSQIDFLSEKYLKVADTKRLVENSMNWAFGERKKTLLGLGIDKDMQNKLSNTLNKMGFSIKFGDLNSNFEECNGILMTEMGLEDKDVYKIKKYVSDFGGGLAIFYSHNGCGEMAMSINKLLSNFNFAFTFCLLNEDIDVLENISIPLSFSYVKNINFISLYNDFKDLIQQKDIDNSVLDDLVTVLRYYILMICEESFSNELEDMAKSAWDFLIRENYSTENGICPKTTHKIVVILLSDLFTKLPPNYIKPVQDHKFFPGKTGIVKQGDFHKTIQLRSDVLISTGLWLPAGVCGMVECQNLNLNIHIQVGSHQESLLTKPGPWKRWPSIVSINFLQKKETTIASPFGGIVYVATFNIQSKEPTEIDLVFHNFCECPMAIYSNSSIWNATKDIDVPWGEIITKDIIFTVPTKKMREINDFEQIFKTFDIITQELRKYIGNIIEKPYRIVFDIELPYENPSCSYPIVFKLEDIDGILINFKEPTPELFNVVVLLVIFSICEDCFDGITENAIASLIATLIFQKLYHDFDPFEMEGITIPTLFRELWTIHFKYDSSIIPKVLAKFQDPNYQPCDVPEDNWISFVREICTIGQKDFTKLLERSRPIPLNISMSLHGLPPFEL